MTHSQLVPSTSVALPCVGGMLVALVVVVGHLWLYDGDLSEFVHAAPPLAQADQVPDSLRLLDPAQAYDGMFFYRLAVDPGATREVGITLDNPSYRQQRILYPLIVRVLALGQDDRVPFALVAVNVIGLAVLGGLGASFATQLFAPAWYGIVLPLWTGFSFSLTRDLSEIVQSCFLVGTLLALQQNRWRLAGVLLPLAILARETAVILALALLAWSAIERVTGRRQIGGAWFAGATGLAAYVCMQGAMWGRWGVPPTLAGAANVAVVLSGPIHYWIIVGLLGRVELAVFALLVVLGLVAPRVPGAVRLALVGYLALMLMLSNSVWDGDVAWLRAGTEAAMLAWLSIFHAGRRHFEAALVATTALWPAVARWAIGT